MKTAYFDYETRAIIDVAPNVLGGGYVIARVNTPFQHRRQGIARRLMAELLADADAEGVELWLDINPYGEMTYQQLAAWYGRCGFEKVDVAGGRRYRRLPRDKATAPR